MLSLYNLVSYNVTITLSLYNYGAVVVISDTALMLCIWEICTLWCHTPLNFTSTDNFSTSSSGGHRKTLLTLTNPALRTDYNADVSLCIFHLGTLTTSSICDPAILPPILCVCQCQYNYTTIQYNMSIQLSSLTRKSLSRCKQYMESPLPFFAYNYKDLETCMETYINP